MKDRTVTDAKFEKITTENLKSKYSDTINTVSSTISNPPTHENIERNTHFEYLIQNQN